MGNRRGRHTVDGGLVCLAANLAGQVADAGLFVDGHGDCVLVVAEEALKRGSQLLSLGAC